MGNIHIPRDFPDDCRLEKCSIVQVHMRGGSTTQLNLSALGSGGPNAVLECLEAFTGVHRSHVHAGTDTISGQSAAYAQSTGAAQDKVVNFIVLGPVDEQPLNANTILTCILTEN